jgi:hypothetical protein
MIDLNIHTIYASLTCKTSDLVETMKFLKRAIPKTPKGKAYMVEITLKTNEAIFVSIGATKTLYCRATGPAKVTIPFCYLFDIIKNLNKLNTRIDFGKGALMVEGLTVKADTFFFNDDSILRSINLPINFTPSDVVKIPDRYTQEEISFNKVEGLIKKAYTELENDITQVHKRLLKYRFNKEE